MKDNIIDFLERFPEIMSPEYDGREACSEILEDAKGEFNHVMVVGFDKNHEFQVYHTDMPMAYAVYIQRLLDRYIAFLLDDSEGEFDTEDL